MFSLQKKRSPAIEIFDPLLGQDYRLPSDEDEHVWFSSLEHGCAVLRMSWMKNWSFMFLEGKYVRRIPLNLLDSKLIYQTLVKTGAVGFLAVCPGQSLESIGCPNGFDIQHYGDSLFTHFCLNEQTVASFIREADSKGTYEEWIIGSATGDFNPVEPPDFDPERQSLCSFHFMSHFSDIGSIWTFDFESGEILGVFRVFDGYVDVVRNITEAFRPPGTGTMRNANH